MFFYVQNQSGFFPAGIVLGIKYYFYLHKLVYMEILKTKLGRNTQGIFLPRMKFIQILSVLFLFILCTVRVSNVAAQDRDQMNVAPPSWAPDYDSQNSAHYYYLPDIECYYDLWNREFVYLEEGNWQFSPTLPPIYAGYDLNNCFTVILNNSVHEPWMHFHYYVAHYPRFYYKSINRDGYHDNARPLRGFNENGKGLVYNNRPGNFSGNRNEARPVQGLKHDQPERSTRPAQPMKYYGKQIGQPVKVQRNMMKPQEKRNRER